MNGSMIRPQARALSQETWQEKAVDTVAPARPRVCPGPGSCCHRDLQLFLTDILFLPEPVSEAWA